MCDEVTLLSAKLLEGVTSKIKGKGSNLGSQSILNLIVDVAYVSGPCSGQKRALLRLAFLVATVLEQHSCASNS